MDFSRTEQLVIDTFGMPEKIALKHLKDNGVNRERSWYYNKKTELKEKSNLIIYNEAKNFSAKHVERITTLRRLHNKTLEILENETNPLIQLKAIDTLSKLQYDIAAFDEASGDVIEQGKTSISIPEKQLRTPTAT